MQERVREAKSAPSASESLTYLLAKGLLPLQADLGVVQIHEDVHVTAPHAEPVHRGPKLVDRARWV